MELTITIPATSFAAAGVGLCFELWQVGTTEVFGFDADGVRHAPFELCDLSYNARAAPPPLDKSKAAITFRGVAVACGAPEAEFVLRVYVWYRQSATVADLVPHHIGACLLKRWGGLVDIYAHADDTSVASGLGLRPS